MSTTTNVADVHSTTVRPRLWTPEELAEYLGVTLHCVYAWSSKGGGPRVLRVGARLRYRPADVDEWLDRVTSNGEEG
jgi:excisionase family DNA binding protein